MAVANNIMVIALAGNQILRLDVNSPNDVDSKFIQDLNFVDLLWLMDYFKYRVYFCGELVCDFDQIVYFEKNH